MDDSSESDFYDLVSTQNSGTLSQESSNAATSHEVYVSSFSFPDSTLITTTRPNTPISHSVYAQSSRPCTPRSLLMPAQSHRPGTPMSAQSSRSGTPLSLPTSAQSSRAGTPLSPLVSQFQQSDGLSQIPFPLSTTSGGNTYHDTQHSSSTSSPIKKSQPHTHTRKKQKKDNTTHDEVFSEISTRLLDRLDKKKEGESKFFSFGQYLAQEMDSLDEDLADDLMRAISNALYDAKKTQRQRI